MPKNKPAVISITAKCSDMFSARILDKEGNPIEHIATQEKPGKGWSYYAKPGIYSLKINSRGDWTITVIQLP